MEKLASLIRKSIETDISVQTSSIRRVSLASRFLPIDRQLKYIFQIFGYESMWVSISKERIPNLIFPTFYIDFPADKNVNNNLLLVTKSEKSKYIIYDIQNKYNGKEVDLDHFNDSDLNFFLFEKKTDFNSKNAGKKINYVEYLWVTLSLIILLAMLLREGYLFALLACSTFGGAYIFFSILKNYFIKDNNIISDICNAGDKNSCARVLNYKIFDTNIFDFKLLGLIYFSSLSLIIVAYFFKFAALSVGLLSPILLLGIVGVLISLFLQFFKIKTFCKVCLVVSILILLNVFLFLLVVPNFVLLFNDALRSLFFVLVSYIISYLFYDLLAAQSSIHTHEASLTFFKSDIDIFKNVLSLEQKSNIDEHFGVRHFEYGHEAAENTLSLIISLSCSHCYNALGELVDIIEASQKYQIKIWFASYGNPTKEEIFFLNYLLETKTNHNIRELYTELSNWYFAKNKPLIPYQSDVNKFISGVNSTPVILIDNVVVPHFYSVSDLKYLLT